jgi:predicted neuraminidase
MGWQTKNKPFILNNQRLIVPLYSDGFSFSLMAITDNWGKTWQFSEPLVGGGNIQASIVIKKNGDLVTYMRDNGPPPKRLQYAESNDNGFSWSTVKDSELPNPGAGSDAVTLANGNWCLVYNDTEKGRHSLAISISDNEGLSWKWTRHLELDNRGENATSSHYPAVIQGKDGTIHTVYSYHHSDRAGGPHKTIKYAKFNENWVKKGE